MCVCRGPYFLLSRVKLNANPPALLSNTPCLLVPVLINSMAVVCTVTSIEGCVERRARR